MRGKASEREAWSVIPKVAKKLRMNQEMSVGFGKKVDHHAEWMGDQGEEK